MRAIRLRPARVVLCAVTAAALVVGVAAADAGTSGAPLSLPTVSGGGVGAVAVAGTTEYLAGSFGWVGGTATGAFAEIASTGDPSPDRPPIGGEVSAAAPDGAGGWYVAGFLLSVGGVPAGSLVHIDANGTRVASFQPGTLSTVNALAVSGSTVYAGGWCVARGSGGCENLVAFDATTGAQTSFAPSITLSGSGPYVVDVGALAVSGTTLYVGGRFDGADGAARRNLAAFDTTTGDVTPWDPQVASTVAYGGVLAVAVSGSTVYAGGTFDTVNGSTARNDAAAFDAATGTATAWDPDVGSGSDSVNALLASGSTVYAGGQFTTVNGATSRQSLAALDATTGAATSWNPGVVGSSVDALALSGSTLYAGGRNLGVAGTNLAAFDTSTGAATGFAPVVGGTVATLGVDGSNVFVGGSFESVGGTPRNGLASIDLSTGQLTSWDPGGGGNELAVSGSTCFVADNSSLAAIDTSTGTTVWTASVTGNIYTVAVSGSTVYVGGRFTAVNGSTPRTDLAAFDASTGTVASWAPTVSSAGQARVNALAVSGSTVYAGGEFDTANGSTPRNDLAAFDASTGTVTGWDPNVAFSFSTPSINTLAIAGTTVYAGGNFDSVNGSTPRSYAAAFNATTGTATSWNPAASATIEAIAVSGSTVYLAGGGSGLAAYDTATGASSGWAPNPDFSVVTIAATSAYVAVGGRYWTFEAGGVFSPNAAVFDVSPSSPTPVVSSFTPSSGLPGSTVTITGSGFTGTSRVAFGGVTAQSYVVDSDTQIAAVVPPAAVSGPIAVTTPGGTASSSAVFTVVHPPSISGFTPTAAGEHATVTVSGSNFTGATQVKLDGVSVPFSVVSPFELTFTVPAGATSGTIQVTTPAGSATSSGSFTVSPPPTITSISPGSGPVGTVVTITGTHLPAPSASCSAASSPCRRASARRRSCSRSRPARPPARSGSSTPPAPRPASTSSR